MPSLLLILLAVSAAVVAIAGDWRLRRPAFYVAKPLATLALLGLVAMALPAGGRYAQWLLGAIVLCLLGDILLMGRGKAWFAGGLVAFLLGHLLFIGALREGGPFDPPGWSLALASSGIVAAAFLARRAGRLHVAVALYAAVLLAMVVSAAARDAAFAGLAGSRFALCGAVLFMISDSLLATRRFVRDFVGGQALTLASYWLALGLLVRSVPTAVA